MPNYESISSTAFINQPFANAPIETDATTDEKATLEAEKADVIKRIERYKEKLNVKKMLERIERDPAEKIDTK